jgi:hypothetical protein
VKAGAPGAHFVATFGEYAIEVCPGGWLPTWDDWRRQAALVDDRMVPRQRERGEDICTIAVRGAASLTPFLMVAASYHRSAGFAPGVFLVPETRRLFVGIGEHIAVYGLDPPARCWDDHTEYGFLGWARHGDVIVMAAELELAAWDLIGSKLWSTFVEPPWTYEVAGSIVRLDVMGTLATFPLHAGPSPETPTPTRPRKRATTATPTTVKRRR